MTWCRHHNPYTKFLPPSENEVDRARGKQVISSMFARARVPRERPDGGAYGLPRRASSLAYHPNLHWPVAAW